MIYVNFLYNSIVIINFVIFNKMVKLTIVLGQLYISTFKGCITKCLNLFATYTYWRGNLPISNLLKCDTAKLVLIRLPFTNLNLISQKYSLTKILQSNKSIIKVVLLALCHNLKVLHL